MTKKIVSIITLLFISTFAIFSESIGFTSVHSGFWWWTGAIVITAVLIAGVSVGLGFWLYEEIFWDTPGDLDIFLKVFWIFITSVFSILGFWVIPSVWCSLISCIVGAVVFLSLLYSILTCPLDREVDPHTWILSFLLCSLTIAAEVFVMIYLPNNWWLWKYVSVAVLGSGIANILSLDSHYFNQRKAALMGTILLIVDFITFWIVFGICRWNVASVILGIIFCLLVFVSLISPFICMIIRKIQKDIKKRDDACAILGHVKKLSEEISMNPRYVELHPEDKEFYEKYKSEIDKQVQQIFKDIKEQETKKIHEEQKQKKLEREEDARESAFQKNLKSISEDIDALELAVGKGIFNIQQLTILENHISSLNENKSLFDENKRNVFQRKKKYLEAIFQDCEKLPDCKGSAKIRMKEILKMLDDLNKFRKQT